MRNDLKAITLTIIFESSALNRDEKLGGNIPSIKKLTRSENKTYSYLSKVAMRHYLYETLFKKYPDDWKETPCIASGKSGQKVVQFNLAKANILNYAELDAFGYMFTSDEGTGITRKAPVGITKAVSLETWEGDMQFNANLDLAKRCNTNPNPVNKEEHLSFYKVSFTVDIDRLGYDEWWIKEKNYDGTNLILLLSEETLSKIQCEKESDEKYVVKNDAGKIGIIEIKEEQKVVFKLDDAVKKNRLKQILTVLRNGLVYHSSGENYGIVPQFLIAAWLKLPVPLFHPFVGLGDFENSVLENEYILEDENKKKLIYVYNPRNLVKNIPELYTDWKEFLDKIDKNGERNEKGSEG